MWASLTLALLTLPVVLVPTEEALSSVPSSMREGSMPWRTSERRVCSRVARSASPLALMSSRAWGTSLTMRAQRRPHRGEILAGEQKEPKVTTFDG